MRDVVADRIGSDLASPNRLQVGVVKPSIYTGDEVEASEDELLTGDEGDGVDVERRYSSLLTS